MQSRITGCYVSLAVILFCLSMLVTVRVTKYLQLRSLFEMQSFICTNAELHWMKALWVNL